MQNQVDASANSPMSLEARKAMVGSIRYRINVDPLDGHKFLGGFMIEKYIEYPVYVDYPGTKDDDGMVRGWSPQVGITFREARVKLFGINPLLITNKTRLEEFLIGFAQISAQALRDGLDHHNIERVYCLRKTK